ncbi:hypothetical protein [Candidatus Methanoprimaticola sp. MG2]|uniref:hypothetical protein n=1 Tax=Candidatus Methanoprimaticola sp. MG2 TaxID=3228838 RepID=UPI0039C5AE49
MVVLEPELTTTAPTFEDVRVPTVTVPLLTRPADPPTTTVAEVASRLAPAATTTTPLMLRLPSTEMDPPIVSSPDSTVTSLSLAVPATCLIALATSVADPDPEMVLRFPSITMDPSEIVNLLFSTAIPLI